MRQEHPDDRFMLSGEERFQFRQICRELAEEEVEADVHARPGWAIVMTVCGLLVFFGLAANSVFLVLVAAGGAIGARTALRR